MNNMRIQLTAVQTNCTETMDTSSVQKISNNNANKIQQQQSPPDNNLSINHVNNNSQNRLKNKKLEKTSSNQKEITSKFTDIIASELIPTTDFFIFNSSPPTRNTPVANPKKGDCYKNKGPKSVWILQQNIHGLQAKNQNKFEGTLDRIRELNVDIVGLCETCVNMGNDKVQQKFKSTIARETAGASLTVSIIPINYKKPYLPGGTLNLTIGKWRSYLNGG
jgi:hypothetical protein